MDRFKSEIRADTRNPVRRFWDREVVGRYEDVIHNDVFNLPVQLVTGVRMDDPVTPGNVASAALSLAPLGAVTRTAAPVAGAAKRTLGQWWAGRRLAKATDRLAVLESRSAALGDTVRQAGKMLEAKTYTAAERAAIRQTRAEAALAKANVDRKAAAAQDLVTRRSMMKTEADVIARSRADRKLAESQIKALRRGDMEGAAATEASKGTPWWTGVADHVMNHKWSYGIGLGSAAVIVPGTVAKTSGDGKKLESGTAVARRVQTDVDLKWNSMTNNASLAEAMSDVSAAKTYVRQVKSAMDYQRGRAPKDKDGNIFLDDYRRSIEVAKGALAPLMGSSIWKKLEDQALSAYSVDAPASERKNRETLEKGWKTANPHPVGRVMSGFDALDPNGEEWNGIR